MLQRPGERYQYGRQARAATKDLEAGYQIAIVGRLLGQPSNERKHQHAIPGGGQWQRAKEVRRRERPIQKLGNSGPWAGPSFP